ncbi:Protein of unknown function [Gryllus bimaculatus]|nr:Protein of unknown function [Gryllus bimaculatus]
MSCKDKILISVSPETRLASVPEFHADEATMHMSDSPLPRRPAALPPRPSRLQRASLATEGPPCAHAPTATPPPPPPPPAPLPLLIPQAPPSPTPSAESSSRRRLHSRPRPRPLPPPPSSLLIRFLCLSPTVGAGRLSSSAPPVPPTLRLASLRPALRRGESPPPPAPPPSPPSASEPPRGMDAFASVSALASAPDRVDPVTAATAATIAADVYSAVGVTALAVLAC